jgi:hypothetical protein
MREVRRIAASAARPDILLWVCNRQQTAVFTGVTREGIRTFH